MINLIHNITEDRFFRVEYEPSCSDVPHQTFVRKEGEEEMIERTISFCVADTDTINIKAFRKITDNGIEYIQKYEFVIVEEKGSSGEFDDGFAKISVRGARLLEPEIGEPELESDGLDKIVELGYNSAEELFSRWNDLNEEDPENWPVDENGNPDREAFCDILNDDLWETGFEYIEDTPELAEILERCGQDKVGYTYFDGVNKYIEESFK